MIQKIFQKHHKGFDILKCWGNRPYDSDWYPFTKYTTTIEQWYEVPFNDIDWDFNSIEQAEYYIEKELVQCL